MGPNHLYYGDNLPVLRRYIDDESIDLIYIDPPFNSNANYNILFKGQDGGRATAQIKAFTDTWRWDQGASQAYDELMDYGGKVAEALRAFRLLLGESDMLAYLAMMAPRLIELHRVLGPTGSFYLHCDPAASHYLKIILDTLFGPGRFRSEIVWKRSAAHNDTKQGRQIHGHIHDVLLFYTKGDEWTWNPIYTPYDDDYTSGFYRHIEVDTGRRYRLGDLTGPGGAANGNPSYEVMGVTRYWRYTKEKMQALIDQGRVVQTRPGTVPAYKRYLDEMPGIALQDLWTDIRPIGAQAAERLGYPTQKPLSLLERIIECSSNPGDVVLDAFCGCGTTVSAAQRLERRWIGIDITLAAITVIRNRLINEFGAEVTPRPLGEPESLEDAAELARTDRYQFQWWALGRVGARHAEEKKGADRGIDGRLFFDDDGTNFTKEVIISVKSGPIPAAHVRELRGVIEREKAAIGVLLTYHAPSAAMKKEAASAGTYESVKWGRRYPRLQIITIEEVLAGKQIQCPPLSQVNRTFTKAPKHKRPATTYQRPLTGTAVVEVTQPDNVVALRPRNKKKLAETAD
jgi:DNA modification methylase